MTPPLTSKLFPRWRNRERSFGTPVARKFTSTDTPLYKPGKEKIYFDSILTSLPMAPSKVSMQFTASVILRKKLPRKFQSGTL